MTKTPVPKDVMRTSKLIDGVVWDGKDPKAYAGELQDEGGRSVTMTVSREYRTALRADAQRRSRDPPAPQVQAAQRGARSARRRGARVRRSRRGLSRGRAAARARARGCCS